MDPLPSHPVVSRDEWRAARQRLLAHEQEYTRWRDRLSEERRALPWVKVDQACSVEGPQGRRSLADLFGGRSQLFIDHFMLAPGDVEGCEGCPFIADPLASAAGHLQHHDAAVAMVSRAPLDNFRRDPARRGWNLAWASSAGSDFNVDSGVSLAPEPMATGEVEDNDAPILPWGPDAHGPSAFCRDPHGAVFHTYSSCARGDEDPLTTYMVLDLMPLGRNEADHDGQPMGWVRRHDAPDTAPARACCGG